MMLETDFSFPSGHAVAATTLYGVLAIFLWQQRRYGWSLLAAGWVLLIALSRVYLGVHYPSDVLASIILGSLWLMLVFASVDWLLPRLRNSPVGFLLMDKPMKLGTIVQSARGRAD